MTSYVLVQSITSTAKQLFIFCGIQIWDLCQTALSGRSLCFSHDKQLSSVSLWLFWLWLVVPIHLLIVAAQPMYAQLLTGSYSFCRFVSSLFKIDWGVSIAWTLALLQQVQCGLPITEQLESRRMIWVITGITSHSLQCNISCNVTNTAGTTQSNGMWQTSMWNAKQSGHLFGSIHFKCRGMSSFFVFWETHDSIVAYCCVAFVWFEVIWWWEAVRLCLSIYPWCTDAVQLTYKQVIWLLRTLCNDSMKLRLVFLFLFLFWHTYMLMFSGLAWHTHSGSFFLNLVVCYVDLAACILNNACMMQASTAIQ